MEGDKAKLTEQLNKFEDWYKAIIFDTNGIPYFLAACTMPIFGR